MWTEKMDYGDMRYVNRKYVCMRTDKVLIEHTS